MNQKAVESLRDALADIAYAKRWQGEFVNGLTLRVEGHIEDALKALADPVSSPPPQTTQDGWEITPITPEMRAEWAERHAEDLRIVVREVLASIDNEGTLTEQAKERLFMIANGPLMGAPTTQEKS